MTDDDTQVTEVEQLMFDLGWLELWHADREADDVDGEAD